MSTFEMWPAGAGFATRRPERRRWGRRVISAPLFVWRPNAVLEAPGSARIPVMVRDTSLEGAKVNAAVPLGVGSEAVLVVEVRGRTIEMPVRIVHLTLAGESPGERVFAHGCKFIGMSARDTQELAAHAWT